MLKLKDKTILFMIALLWSNSLFASWSFTGKVEEVQSYADGRVIVTIDRDTSGTTTCTNRFFTIAGNEVGAKQVMSVVLAAKVANKDVAFVWDGAGNNCSSFGNHHTIWRVIMVKEI